MGNEKRCEHGCIGCTECAERHRLAWEIEAGNQKKRAEAAERALIAAQRCGLPEAGDEECGKCIACLTRRAEAAERRWRTYGAGRAPDATGETDSASAGVEGTPSGVGPSCARHPWARSMSETDLVQAILVELSKRDCLVWRNNSGALYETYPVTSKESSRTQCSMRNGAQVFIDGEPVYFRGRIVRFGLEGSADIVGWCRKCGRFIAPEGKAPRGRLSDAQIAWGAQAKSAGVVYCVARSVQDAIDVVEQHQRQHQRNGG